MHQRVRRHARPRVAGSGRRTTIADTGGGANGAALAADGGFVVTQNGGIDFSVFEIFGDAPAAALRAVGTRSGCAPDGAVTYLTPDPTVDRCSSPTTCASRPTARCSSPIRGGRRRPPPGGRVFALEPDGSLRLAAEGFWAPNGIILDVDGETLIVVENGRHGEHHGFVRLAATARARCSRPGAWATAARSTPTAASTWRVVGTSSRSTNPTAPWSSVLQSPGDHPVSTNLCFGGDDLRTLFAVDAGTPGPRVLLDRHADTRVDAPSHASWPAGHLRKISQSLVHKQ